MADRIQSLKVVCAGGLNSNENHLSLAENDPGSATRLVNYEPSLFGGYRRLSGFEYLDDLYPEVGVDVTEGKVLGVAVFRNEGNGNPYVIAARKDLNLDTYSFWKFTDYIGWEKMAAPARAYTDSGLTVNRVRTVQFDFGAGGHMAFVDGVNNAVIFDGTTWTEIDPGSNDQAISRPSVVEVFENHLFVSGDPTAQAVVSHSAPSDPLDWTAASGGGQLTLGFPVVQIKPFRNDLFAFGSNSIKKISVDASANFVTEQVTSNVGCIARDSVQEIGGDLVFLAPDGFRPVAGTSRIGDVELETISRPIRGRLIDLIENFDLDTLVSVVVRGKSQYRIFFGDDAIDPLSAPGIVGGLTTKEGQISWEYGDLVGIQASCATSEYVNREEFVLHGGYDGCVYRQEKGNSFNGENIVSIYSTPYLDFGETEVRKVIHKLNTFIRAEGPLTIDVAISYDWGDQYSPNPASYQESSAGVEGTYGGRGVTYSGLNVTYGGSTKPVMISNVQGSGFSARVTYVTNSQETAHTIQGLVIEFGTAGRRE